MSIANAAKDERLTFDEFKDGLTERLEQSITCPVCSQDGEEWVCPGYAELPAANWDGTEKGVLNLFPVICPNCGFTAHFASFVLR